MILDTNTWVGHWPFHPLRNSTPSAIDRHLARLGIHAAWTAPADAVLLPDPQIANQRWLPRIARQQRLTPVAVIDPTLGNWRDSLRRCAQEWRARIVKLVPSYRAFALDDPRVDQCIETATEMGMIISVQVRMEDERRHHPLMQVPPPDPAHILALAQRHPQVRFHIACAYLPELRQLAQTDNLVFEISSLERLDTLKTLLETVPPERLCFGSHTPFFYTQSALLKLQTARVDEDTVLGIAAGPPHWRVPHPS